MLYTNGHQFDENETNTRTVVSFDCAYLFVFNDNCVNIFHFEQCIKLNIA